MRALLDTCTLIWATIAPQQLTGNVQQIIANEQNAILVSAATAWEIATKVRLGKLPGAERLELEFVELMSAAGYSLLDIDAAAALRAGRLPGEHRDPFDRVLAAQAIALDIPILSPDVQLDPFGVRRIW